MRAFDTDVLTEVLAGSPTFVDRAARIPSEQQAIPVVVAEEIVRGRLNVIGQAEAGRAHIPLDFAYQLFERTLRDFQRSTILPYTPESDAIFRGWRERKIRASTHDLRIAAICVAHHAVLISRNRRDFRQIPDLEAEFWDD